MITPGLVRAVLLRYPKSNSSIYINPEACNVPSGFLQEQESEFQEAKNAENADYILVHIDYANPFNKATTNFLEKYPEKCVNVTTFLEIFCEDLPEIQEEEYFQIKKLLSSNDFESIYLGLNILKGYKINDNLRYLILPIIDRYTNKYGQMSIINPVTNEEIPIYKNDLIKYYHLLLRNNFIV